MPKRTPERIAMDRKVLICALLAVVFLGLLGIRLWQLQVLQGAEHRQKTSRQSIRPVRMNPVRGRIYTSDGELLVGNRCVYDVVFHLAEMRQPGKFANTVTHILAKGAQLGQLLGKPSGLTAAKVSKHLNQSPVIPLTIYQNLTEEELCKVWELSPWIEGLEILPRFVRDYRYPGMLSQVLGFTGTSQPDHDFMGPDYRSSYVMPEQSGRSGLELTYDKLLSGNAGAKLVRVDPMGYARNEVSGTIPSQNGYDLILAIDSRAQSYGEEALDSYKGALVLMDIKTGGVMAMVSKPGFDLSMLTASSYAAMNQDAENKPLLNRAVNAQYTPGSIVKPIVGLAALEAGSIDTEWQHNCIGYYQIGNTRIHCAKRYGHGPVDIYDAITVSCNPFFMDVGIHTKLDRLEPMFKAVGFGEKTGIDVTEFARGLCPSRKAAQDRYHRSWLLIDTAYCSMGQGLILVTPLQVVSYCAALANGGTLLRPYLVQEVRDQNGRIIRQTHPEVRGYLPVSEYNMDIVRSAMQNAVESPQGSGRLLNTLTVNGQHVALAAKTGTAELGTGDDKTKDTWMIVFGPLPHPKYAFACVVEHGDSGSKTVAPIALEFWSRWLKATGL